MPEGQPVFGPPGEDPLLRPDTAARACQVGSLSREAPESWRQGWLRAESAVNEELVGQSDVSGSSGLETLGASEYFLRPPVDDLRFVLRGYLVQEVLNVAGLLPRRDSSYVRHQ